MKKTTSKQIIIRITAIITLVELIIMMVYLKYFLDLSSYAVVILDTALLVIFSIPIIYIWVIKPYLVTHETRIANILENTNDAYLTLDKNWIITYVNPISESFLNIKPGEVIGRDFRNALPDMVSMFYPILNTTFSTQIPQQATALFGPTMKYLEVHANPTTEGLSLNFRDITFRRKSEEALRIDKELEFKNKEKIKLTAELTSYMKAIDQHALVSVTDSTGRIIEANEKFCEISGYSREELVGQNHNIVNSGVHPKTFFSEMWTTIASGHKWQGELCNRAQDGTLYWVDSTIVPVIGEDGQIERYISVRIDITRRKQQEKEILKANEKLAKANIQLEHISRIDGLTQISNRRHFDEALLNEMNQLNRTNNPLTLILCDIDYFKNYNDSYGHIAGDACLQMVARSINSIFSRTGDVVARYGGEEFAVILANITKETALTIAEKIRESVAQLNQKHESSKVEKVVTISIGVTTLVPDKNTTVSMIIEKADKALYMAKKKGRNNVQFFL